MHTKNIYYLAPNLYWKIQGAKTVLFNPDLPGNPILVRDDISMLLKKCAQGFPLQELLSFVPSALALKEKESFLSFLNNSHIIQAKTETNLSGIVYPPFKRILGAWLHITNECNLQCPYCFVKKSAGSIIPENIGCLIKSLLNGAGKYGCNSVKIKFSGGEPMLKFELIKRIVNGVEKYKHENIKINYAILSNGTIMDKDRIEFIKCHKIGIGISLDGYREVHDKTRKYLDGKGSFQVIENNILSLKDRDIYPFVMATISEETIPDLWKLTNWLMDNKLYSRYSFVRYPNYSISDYKRFCEKIVVSMSKCIKEIKKHPFGPKFVLNWKIADLSFNIPIKRQPCGIGKSHFVINHLGGLALCPMTLDDQIGTIDNDIFGQYKKCERRYDQPMPKDKCCQECRWFHVCGTGCPILNERLTGHPNKRSPFCNAYRKLIPMYIDTYGWALNQLASKKMTSKQDTGRIWQKEI